MTCVESFPLINLGAPDIVVAWRAGRPITLREFLGDVHCLAEQLPRRKYQVNLCEDRYRFLVASIAAVSTNQILLLPSFQAPEELSRLRKQHPSSYCLTDTDYDGELELFKFEELLENGDGSPRFFSIPADKPLVELYTSGSTGTAVAHKKTWGMLYTGAELTGKRLGLDQLSQASVLSTVSPQHMYGLETSIMLPLRWGLAVSVERPLFAADIVAALERLPVPRILVTTPLHLRGCLSENFVLPKLEFILSSTAHLPQKMAQQAEQSYSTRVLEIYGSTETGAVATRRTASESDWKILPGLSLERDKDLWSISAEHFPKPVSLNDRIKSKSPGFFQLLGRSTDLIKIAGKRASLEGLNSYLLSIDGVSDGVFFVPEPADSGNIRIAALVVAPDVNEQHILATLRKKIDPAFLPRPLYRVETLPRNATGKLSRQSLLALFEQCNHQFAKQIP